MKKSLIIFGVLFLVLVSCFYIISQEQPIAATNNCKHFNGKDFILTGGSQHPQTIEEVNLEMARLNWLCSGGNKQ